MIPGTSRLDVYVAQPFARVENPLGNEVGGMQPGKPCLRRLRPKYFPQLRDQRVYGVRASCKIGEARIAREVLAPDRRTQPLVLRLIHQRDHHPAVGGLI